MSIISEGKGLSTPIRHRSDTFYRINVYWSLGPVCYLGFHPFQIMNTLAKQLCKDKSDVRSTDTHRRYRPETRQRLKVTVDILPNVAHKMKPVLLKKETCSIPWMGNLIAMSIWTKPQWSKQDRFNMSICRLVKVCMYMVTWPRTRKHISGHVKWILCAVLQVWAPFGETHTFFLPLLIWTIIAEPEHLRTCLMLLFTPMSDDAGMRMHSDATYKPIIDVLSGWRHDMEKLSALVALCEGLRRSPVESPHKWSLMRSFDNSFWLVWTSCKNKQSSWM